MGENKSLPYISAPFYHFVRVCMQQATPDVMWRQVLIEGLLELALPSSNIVLLKARRGSSQFATSFLSNTGKSLEVQIHSQDIHVVVQ